MNTGRPVHLDLGMPPSTAFDQRTGQGGQTGGQPRNTDTLGKDAQHLRALLDQQRSATPAPAAAPPAAARPFDLFGTGTPSPAAHGSAPATANAAADVPAGIDDALSHMAQRMLVGDGSTGRRAVRIQLADDSLPGVEVEVLEEAGDLVAQFTCAVESSRERLARNAQWLADGLAQRLGRSACVRVQTDDPEDLCLVEVRAP